ncbi:hypothetical protein [Spirosoma sordidisoli]|uniref:Uncharacterized protein n=1 Tax=Spirosoma sordidisoli TaxID=2502893 RepID=A0A4Q2ULS0_9BACT|nr:hypothetical protein [Spirosoma sordidisoli]RYC70186.1 hypothetical protein EQG79_09980 [Spirosoma sordidisoli]
MDHTIDFLSPRLEGKRFDDHTLPVNILEDFSALEELIFELSKKIYLEENPHRKRVPKGFNDEVSLKLAGVGEGSAIPRLVLVYTLAYSSFFTEFFPKSEQYSVTNLESVKYLEKARDRVIELISNAQSGEKNKDILDQKYLNYFNRIGKNLQDGETMAFPKAVGGSAVLDKEIRKKILLSRKENIEYSDYISVNAYITEFDKKQNSFTLDIGGNNVVCNINEDYYEIVHQVFNEYEKNTQVAIKATGIYNQQDRLIRVENIESMDILDPFDVKVRIAQLVNLGENWYNGTGKAPDKVALKQFEEYFSNYFGSDLPLPSIFPTIEGNIQLEWTNSDRAIILELDLDNFLANLIVTLLKSNSYIEREFFLSTLAGWEELNSLISKINYE